MYFPTVHPVPVYTAYDGAHEGNERVEQDLTNKLAVDQLANEGGIVECGLSVSLIVPAERLPFDGLGGLLGYGEAVFDLGRTGKVLCGADNSLS